MKIIPIVTGAIAENTYIAFENGTDAAVVIDPGDEAQSIIDVLEENAVRPVYILLTHGHFDHVGAVEEIRNKYGCKVAIHKTDAEMLTQPATGLFQAVASNAASPADILLEGDEVIRVGDMEICVMHTPGHTGGCVCYIIGNNMFSGDTLFMQSIGRTDFSESDPVAMRDSLDRLNNLDMDYKVFPGHGASTTLAEEKKYNPYLS
ncbi:MBL fold metallo-hydrolase [Christensenellaceae bacterium OttesenSCG-928-K19]|nr:MBL fold metallo-hydrolase [Christensenellaceae bacterium OttesenSCG-928-K19]